MEYYAGSFEHVLAELDRLDLLIRAQVWRARELRKGERDGLPAFYIPEDEVEALLEHPVGSPFWAGIPLPPDMQRALQNTLDEMGSLIHARTAESLRRGIDLRLARLGYRLGLSAFDLDVLLVCLAPEIDRRYERLYAYLQDDVTRKHPSVALVLDLLCPPLETKIALRQRLAPAAPLRHHGLLHILDDPNLRQLSLLGKHLQFDPRVADYLLGGDQIDERLRPYARLIEPQVSLDDLIMSSDFKARVSDLTRAASGMSPIVYFQGPYGAGKQSIAEGLCKRVEISLLVVDGRRFPVAKAEDFETLVRLASREALLQEAALYWDGFDVLLDEEQVTRRELLLQTLMNHPGLVYLAGDTLWEASNMEQARGFVRVEFPPPTYEQRLQLWRQTLKDDALDLEAVAAKFRFTGGQIQDAGVTARGLAQWRDRSRGQVSDSDLYAACRLQSNRKLATLAQKVTPHYTWDDIVLPPEQIEQLRALCHQVRYRDLVYETWGFDRKLALGKGPSALFAGPPGTGKTMAADIIARELGLDLYKIDLSTVVSKYIGETEKNLSRIFAEARTSNAILFFDEADALFGKRTEVRDAHDRYANIEVSYLLQKMDEYEGVVILATNLRKNMDEAFVRRLRFIVEFPFPKAEERRRIWEGIWPKATPRSPDLDLDFLANRIEVAGGSIRNIALAGAFLAAADGGEVQMRHLLCATQREYRKMGKVLTADEFQ